MLTDCPPSPHDTPTLHLPAHIHIRRLLQDIHFSSLWTPVVHRQFTVHFFCPSPASHWLSPTMYPCSWSEKAWRENLSCTLFLPACPMSLRSCGSLTSLCIASEKASAVGSHRKPVSPSATLSRGPPEFTAITGQQQYMASTGTIPKCSRLGVYSTAALPRSSATFSESEGERRKVTQSPKRSCAASSFSSAKC